MAPSIPLGREQAMKLVAAGSFPISLGSPHPSVMVLQQDRKFRIRELVVDRVAADIAATEARRARTPSWMPEHYYALGQPTGKIYAEAASIAELVEVMRTMTWPANW